jgi:hypothetical protein
VHVLVGARPLSRAEALRPDFASVLVEETVELEVVP